MHACCKLLKSMEDDAEMELTFTIRSVMESSSKDVSRNGAMTLTAHVSSYPSSDFCRPAIPSAQPSNLRANHPSCCPFRGHLSSGHETQIFGWAGLVCCGDSTCSLSANTPALLLSTCSWGNAALTLAASCLTWAMEDRSAAKAYTFLLPVVLRMLLAAAVAFCSFLRGIQGIEWCVQ